MAKTEPNTHISAGENSVIRQMKQEIASGRHWYLALLEAVGRWDITEEEHLDRCYRYLIAGEAFDWLLLAERLCLSLDGLAPSEERNALLFHGRPPLRIEPDEFKALVGEKKYGQHLNFFYGVTVEEALVSAVEDEVRKERWTSGYHRYRDNAPEVHRRIYGTTQAVLLRRFRKERGYSQLKSITLDQMKEFTYWLFNYRLKSCDKARVASDTRKALDRLESRGYSQKTETPGANGTAYILDAEPVG